MRTRPLRTPIPALLATALALGGCAQPNLGSANGPFLGVWRASYVDPNFGPVASEMILQADGRYQKQEAGANGSLTTIYGGFRVLQDQKLLRLDIERGEPSQTCGPLGCTQIRYPAGESYTYGFTDANTLQLHFYYCPPNQCNYTYRRAAAPASR